jgi:hypothetical protein
MIDGRVSLQCAYGTALLADGVLSSLFAQLLLHTCITLHDTHLGSTGNLSLGPVL